MLRYDYIQRHNETETGPIDNGGSNITISIVIDSSKVTVQIQQYTVFSQFTWWLNLRKVTTIKIV